MDKKEEYLMLREEILAAQQTIKSYRTTTYTLVVAILAFAINKSNPWLFLVPFIAIIPLFLLSIHQIDAMIRIGAYIYVFLEPETGFRWETNLYKYDLLYTNQYSTQKPSIDSYVAISACCIILSIAHLDFSNILSFQMIGCILTQVLVLLLCFWCFTIGHIDYAKSKQQYIRKWTKVKNGPTKKEIEK